MVRRRKVVLARGRDDVLRILGAPAPPTTPPLTDPPSTPEGDRGQAEGQVVMVCFKHGPPRLHGVEVSPPPAASVAELITLTASDVATLAGLIDRYGLVLGFRASRTLEVQRHVRRML